LTWRAPSAALVDQRAHDATAAEVAKAKAAKDVAAVSHALKLESIALRSASQALADLNVKLHSRELELGKDRGQLADAKSALRKSAAELKAKAQTEVDMRRTVREQMAALGSMSADMQRMQANSTAMSQEIRTLHDRL